MQNKLLRFVTLLISVMGIFSCDEDGARLEIKKNVAANEMSPLSATTFVLTSDAANDEFDTFEWAAPDFGFPAGGNYTLQADVAENNFATPVNIVTTSQRSVTLTVEQMNRQLLNLGVSPGEPATIEFRVITNINPNVTEVISTVISVTITPYSTSFPPIYAVGDALQGWGTFVRMHSTAASVYETIVYFTSGNKFRYLAQAGWDGADYKWSFFTSVPGTLNSAGDADGNILFTGTSGWYKMITNLNTKSITLAPENEPKLFIVGDDQAWSFDNAVELTFINDGVFQVTTSFNAGSKFRFFTSKGWEAGVNYTYFQNGEVDEYFTPANDGDGNFLVAGESGTFVVTVDLYEYTVTVEAPPAPPEAIYIIGDLNSWSLTTAIELSSIGYYKFEGTITIASNQIFRFFLTPAWEAQQYGWSDFTTIDSNLEMVGDGDDNIRFVGADGNYKITADLQNKTIQLTAL